MSSLSPFPSQTEEDWQAAVRRAGSDAETLSTTSDDGVRVGPIYPRASDASPIGAQAPGSRWRIVQRISEPSAEAIVRACREEIAGGADGVTLAFAGSLHPLGGSIPAAAAEAIARGLTGLAGLREVRIDAGAASAALASAFDALRPGGVAVAAWFDPIAAAAGGGTTDAGAAGTIADDRLWHAWGASEVQELAIALATLVELLRQAERSGSKPAEALPALAIVLAADSDQFPTIAKFRAMRLLAMRLAGTVGGDATVPIHAETAWRMMSRREPRMNTLRTTGAAFAAATGGADSITVLAHDVLDGDSAESRRLARNTQLILAEEAQVFRTADPAAGSGAVEALTDALAERAWAHFQRIETEGGILAAIQEGWLPAEVGTMRARRLDNVADGAIDMVGVNVFAEEKARRAQVRDAHDRLAFRRLAEAVEDG